MLTGQDTPFLSQLRRHFESSCKKDPLDLWRTKGWEHLSKLGLPSKSQGAFQYVPLREFYTHSFEPTRTNSIEKEEVLQSIYPECRHSYLVFVDGHLRLDWSDLSGLPPQIVLLPLAQAFRTYGNILNSRLSQSLHEEKDPFAALNLSLHADGAFLFIPPKIELAQPIQCLHFFSSADSALGLAMPRLHLFLGAHSRLKWICSSHQQTSQWFNGYTDVVVEEGAHFQAINLIFPQDTGWHFHALRATVKQAGCFSSTSITTGAKTVRQDYRIALTAPNATAKLQGIGMLTNSCHAHTHVFMDHQAPHTQSTQLFKGVLNDYSHCSFEGKIYVDPEAQKTEAYQLNNHLVLSDQAVANAKPNLEIFADDVKASHGATVAQIDPAQLFYLQTRGIDNALAKTLLISGFCQEILTQIPYLSIAQEMQSLLRNFLQLKRR